jgi:hypothetical protein
MEQALPKARPVAFFAARRSVDHEDRVSVPVFRRKGQESGIAEQVS